MGVAREDWWHDIDIINQSATERLGYPTQKPLALLDRIIRASTNEGDMILDPFCGCGTTVVAAHNAGNRRWAGIDISSFAIDLIKQRRFKDVSVSMQGIPYDHRSAERLAADKPFHFETWAINRIPGFAPNKKQVGDGGIDGSGTLIHQPDNWDSRFAVAQVKGWKPGASHASAVRDFKHVMTATNAAMGVYVTLHPVSIDTGPDELRYSATTYKRLQSWSIHDYFKKGGCRLLLPPMNDPYNGKPLNQLALF